MAIGPIEMATIARSQDYTTIKHNEDHKVVTDQSNIVGQAQKEVGQKTRQVQEGENPEWQEKKFDAKEKGGGQYGGDGGKRRRGGPEADGKVTVKKKPGGFDIKI